MRESEITVIPLERIQSKILLIRGQKVMLDSDLADLYQVETKVLIQSVKRNLDRFPADFMFLLSEQEVTILRSQFVTSRFGHRQQHGGRRSAPYVFTEHGVAMLSSVLRSKRAEAINIQIIRSFIKLRELLSSNEALSRRMTMLEQKADAHSKSIVSILRELEKPISPRKPRIGF